ncbi:unnamed protein product [Phytophthora fragariaefolia]|uniref:Unnamed protein product n=1 Tax=Phytophthora fragariaefolia TaxID=1490495 RepID=A0A9W6YB35_9STRA|nr:unnamed protein product [Phytophthora fragariaefolia]
MAEPREDHPLRRPKQAPTRLGGCCGLGGYPHLSIFVRSATPQLLHIGENVYTKEGRTRIKIPLAGSLVYIFDIWVGDLAGQETILGMDFMVPAVIRLDLAVGFLSLPDEIRIQLSGRRQLYHDKTQLVRLDQHLQLGVGESAELPVRLRGSGHDKLWVTWGGLWVFTVVNGPGKTTNLQITNVGERKLVLCRDEKIGIWLAGDPFPCLQGVVYVGSRRYMNARQLPVQRSGPDPDDRVTGERSLHPDPGDDQLKVDDHQDPDPATDDSLALLNSMVDLGLPSET